LIELTDTKKLKYNYSLFRITNLCKLYFFSNRNFESGLKTVILSETKWSEESRTAWILDSSLRSEWQKGFLEWIQFS